MINFNKPYFNEFALNNILISKEKCCLSGDGYFSRKCCELFKEKWGFNSLLVPSCTHAIEMMCLLLGLNSEDEVLIPSYTFVSTANAFALQGVKVKCVDSCAENPNISPEALEQAITSKTKAVCIIHYAGVSCDMDRIMEICNRRGIILLEDNAQGINSFYKGRPLGSFGVMSAISFHETKNIQCGEGGLLVINDVKYLKRAEIIREKGTNRTQFFKGEVEKYQWIDIGSSHLLSDISAGILYSQLEEIELILSKRRHQWELYYELLHNDFTCNKPNKDGNCHIFYILIDNVQEIKNYLRENGIMATTHYVPLHQSQYYQENFESFKCPNAELFAKRLLRLPLYYELTDKEIIGICHCLKKYIGPKLLG